MATTMMMKTAMEINRIVIEQTGETKETRSWWVGLYNTKRDHGRQRLIDSHTVDTVGQALAWVRSRVSEEV